MLDDLERPRLDWPEPLVVDLIERAYGDATGPRATAAAARLHARFLRALIGGETNRSGPLRIELIACCAARGISSDAIAAADHAVFQELNEIIQARFRNSPRLKLHFVQQLHDALGALTRRDPSTKPVGLRARLGQRLQRAPAFVFSG